MKKRNLTLEGILLTHGHFDHITAVSDLVSAAGGKVYAFQEEKELLINPQLNGSVMMGYEVGVEPDVYCAMDKQL